MRWERPKRVGPEYWTIEEAKAAYDRGDDGFFCVVQVPPKLPCRECTNSINCNGKPGTVFFRRGESGKAFCVDCKECGGKVNGIGKFELGFDKSPRRQQHKHRWHVLSRDSSRCIICGRGCDQAELNVDHILPFSGGGLCDPYNLATMCVDCNGTDGKWATHDPDLAAKLLVEVAMREGLHGFNALKKAAQLLKDFENQKKAA